MAVMVEICNFCAQGRHDLCYNVSCLDYWSNPRPCLCTFGPHLLRKDIVDPNGNVLYKAMVEDTLSILEDARTIIEELEGLSTGPVPENDPGILSEAFPELVEDGPSRTHRLRPDTEVIKDLNDVEIRNPMGEWVPVIPLPLDRVGGVYQCLCGKWRFGSKRYQEHYAYAHILGMEN